jgi:serine phosphatase RsbU (regulator of sigma subunit)
MGKGMSAALMMATVRAAVRTVVRQSSPAAAMRYLGAALMDDLVRTEGFVTLVLAQLDTTEHRLRYVDAGHGHGFIRRAGGVVEELQPRGLPLGIFNDESYDEGSHAMKPGDALILYSDGVIDARPDLVLDRARLAALLRDEMGVQEIVDRMVAVATPDEPIPDDLTVMALRRTQ